MTKHIDKRNMKSVDVWHPELGMRIAYFRDLKKVTQLKLQAQAGYSKTSSMLSIVEQGGSAVKYEKLIKIAAELDVEIETLAFPGEIALEDLELCNKFFRVLKFKAGNKFFPAIENLINQANQEITD